MHYSNQPWYLPLRQIVHFAQQIQNRVHVESPRRPAWRSSSAQRSAVVIRIVVVVVVACTATAHGAAREHLLQQRHGRRSCISGSGTSWNTYGRISYKNSKEVGEKPVSEMVYE